MPPATSGRVRAVAQLLEHLDVRLVLTMAFGLEREVAAVDWLAFRSGYFEHAVDHDYGMSPTDSDAPTAVTIALMLMIPIVIVGLWPRCVARYQRVWS
jgi:hypothetical protein